MTTLLGAAGCSPVILPVGQDVTIQVSAAEHHTNPCETDSLDACHAALLADLDALRQNILEHLADERLSPERRHRLAQRLAALATELRQATQTDRGPTDRQRSHDETKLSMLRVGVRPGLPPAEVYLNTGPALGKTPLSIPVPPGTHRIRVEWPDGRSSQRRVLAHRGSTTLVRVE